MYGGGTRTRLTYEEPGRAHQQGLTGSDRALEGSPGLVKPNGETLALVNHQVTNKKDGYFTIIIQTIHFLNEEGTGAAFRSVRDPLIGWRPLSFTGPT
jgi:hypothetical protein